MIIPEKYNLGNNQLNPLGKNKMYLTFFQWLLATWIWVLMINTESSQLKKQRRVY